MVILFILHGCTHPASAIDWNDYDSLETFIQMKNLGDKYKFIEYAKKNPGTLTYLEAFTAGLLLQQKENYRESVFFFYVAAFHKKGDSLLEQAYSANRSNQLKIIPLSLKKMSGEKPTMTPLFPEAMYELAYSAWKIQKYEDALAILDLSGKLVPPEDPLAEKREYLRALVYQKINPEKAEELFQALYRKWNKTIYLYYLTQYLEKSAQEKAKDNYREIIHHYPYRWIRSQAAWRLKNMGGEHPEDSLLLFPYSGKKPEQFFPTLNIPFSDLSAKGQYFYLKYYPTAFFARNTFERDKWLDLLNSSRLNPSEKAEVFQILAEKLYSASAYEDIISLQKKYGYATDRISYLCVLSCSHSGCSPEDLLRYSYDFLRNNPGNLNVSKIYSDQCVHYHRTGDYSRSRDCFRAVPAENSYYSARSEWYRILAEDKTKDTQEQARIYRNFFLDHPNEYYGILALEKAEKLGAEKITRSVDSFWKEMEKDVTSVQNSMSGKHKTGLFFLLIGDYSRGMDYLKDVSPAKRHLALISLARKVKYPYLAYQSAKAYLKRKDYSINPYTMNAFAREVLFPRPYQNRVSFYAEKYNMDPYMLYAIMRQESGYLESARSSSNAQGLLQLIPSTAKLVNRKEKIPHLDLSNPDHNIRLGSRFFAGMLQWFNGDFRKAAAAYNGGPNYVSRMERIINATDKEDFLEQISRLETYFYVQYTGYNYPVYRILYEN